MKPEVQDYFTEPEEIVKKCSEVLQFQRQHRRRLLSYLLQSVRFLTPIISKSLVTLI